MKKIPVMKSLIIVIAVFIGMLIYGCGNHAPEPTNIVQFREGDICVLRTGSSKEVIVPKTKDELDNILHLAAIDDNEGINLEVVKGNAVVVDAGTSIKVITAGSTVSQIRIENGRNQFQVGWVPNEFIKIY